MRLTMRATPVPSLSPCAVIPLSVALLITSLLPTTPAAAVPAASAGQSATPEAVADSEPRRRSFNDDWRFFRGDAPGAEQPGFDDSPWTTVRLPHDWAIEGPFDPALNPHTGALPISGIGWYRKTFRL